MGDLLTLALLGILFMCLWGFTQCKRKTIMLIIVLSSEWQKPQAPGSGILSRNGIREKLCVKMCYLLTFGIQIQCQVTFQ